MTNKFWMVIRDSGKGSESTQKRHESLEAATGEAERLTRELGVRFVIMEAKSVCCPEEPPVTWQDIS